ncbi:MAG: DUF58 domain-containing protein [Chthoniobacteraceae bacterium]|nr:DUF58 domain-containing protein [Chthoniobacteraceae bacterium]
MISVDPGTLVPIQARMQAAARTLRLPLRNQAWRGMNGAWLGTGTGSSIDFQDHRPYLPGDDPRGIDWQAYARSGNYTMKLYREEVAPGVDLALDVSASMAVDPSKAARTLELFAFAVASALQARGALRCYFLCGENVTPLPAEAALSAQRVAEVCQAAAGQDAASEAETPALHRVPWRTGSLRVWISDLLFPGAPSLHALAAGKGRGVVYTPWSAAEAEPRWDGNVEFVDCETGARRNQRVTPGLLGGYGEAYTRHFTLWREHARRLGVAFARIPAEPDFLAALRQEALPQGAVEAVV